MSKPARMSKWLLNAVSEPSRCLLKGPKIWRTPREQPTQCAQIQMLEDEKSNLDAAIATSIAKAHLLDQELIDMGRLPAVDPSAVEIQNELRRLDEQTAGLLNQAADKQRQNRANVKQVHYYVPFVREVHRSTLWVEVSGDRLWCVTSGDYLSSPIDEDSIRFTRLAGAKARRSPHWLEARLEYPLSWHRRNPMTRFWKLLYTLMDTRHSANYVSGLGRRASLSIGCLRTKIRSFLPTPAMSLSNS